MKVLSGHLTPADKRNIKELLRLGWMEGTINRVTYKLFMQDFDKYGVTYEVKVAKKDRGLVPVPGSPLRISVHTSTFKI